MSRALHFWRLVCGLYGALRSLIYEAASFLGIVVMIVAAWHQDWSMAAFFLLLSWWTEGRAKR